MLQETFRSRTRIATALLLCASLLLSGFATDHARAGENAKRRGEMLELTNDARSRRERDELKLDRELSRYAIKHSRAMARDGNLFHSSNLADKLKGREWSMGGENVGVGSSLTDLQAAFMGSKAHRKNILHRGYDHTAIGVVQSDGNFWVTVIFYG
jgi:uncharacterized protein YkwD